MSIFIYSKRRRVVVVVVLLFWSLQSVPPWQGDDVEGYLTSGGGDGDELIIIVGAAVAADSYAVGCVLDRGARGRIGKWVGRSARGVVSPRPPRAQIRMMEPSRDRRPVTVVVDNGGAHYIYYNKSPPPASALAFCFYIQIYIYMSNNIYQLLLIIVDARASPCERIYRYFIL